MRHRSVQQTDDGGYVVAGVTRSQGEGGDVYLIKTDAEGNVEWERTFGGPHLDRGIDVQATPDGGYVVVGDTESFGAGEKDVFLIKTDPDGEV